MMFAFPFNVLLIVFIGFLLIAIAKAFTPQTQQSQGGPMDDLLWRLDALPLPQFTDLMVSLLAKLGLAVETVTPLDHKMDGIAILAAHPKELVGGIYALYCVRGVDRIVGVDLVHRLRSFAKSEGAMKAIFITTGTFSRDALNAADALPGMPMEFVDGGKLQDWLVEHLPQEVSELPPLSPPIRQIYRFPEP